MDENAGLLKRLSTETNIELWHLSLPLLVSSDIIDAYRDAEQRQDNASIERILDAVQPQTEIVDLIEHYKSYRTAGPYSSVPLRIRVLPDHSLTDQLPLVRRLGLNGSLVNPKYDSTGFSNSIMISSDTEVLANAGGIPVQILDGDAPRLENALHFSCVTQALDRLLRLQSGAHRAERERIFSPHKGAFDNAVTHLGRLKGLLPSWFGNAGRQNLVLQNNPELKSESS